MGIHHLNREHDYIDVGSGYPIHYLKTSLWPLLAVVNVWTGNPEVRLAASPSAPTLRPWVSGDERDANGPRLRDAN